MKIRSFRAERESLFDVTHDSHQEHEARLHPDCGEVEVSWHAQAPLPTLRVPKRH